MPIREIRHRMTFRELDVINDRLLVPILREKGMDVTFSPNRGCVASPGSRFTWGEDSNGKTFIWSGNVPPVPPPPEEVAATEFLRRSRFETVIPNDSIEIRSATRRIRLED